MKTSILSLLMLAACLAPVCAQKAATTKQLDVLTLEAIPEGRYAVTLELKQLDGKPVNITLDSKDSQLSGKDPRLGEIKGRIQSIGNGVFMVQLRGTGYVATQFWVFQPSGLAMIKEIPDRGEKQTAVPQ